MLESQIKNKIKDLIEQKKIKKAKLSMQLGYSKAFLSNTLREERKFFNLEQIEKICKALDYPVWKLFKEEKEELPEGMLVLSEPATKNIYRADNSELDRVIEKLNKLPKEKREHAIKLIKNMVDAYE